MLLCLQKAPSPKRFLSQLIRKSEELCRGKIIIRAEDPRDRAINPAFRSDDSEQIRPAFKSNGVDQFQFNRTAHKVARMRHAMGLLVGLNAAMLRASPPDYSQVPNFLQHAFSALDFKSSPPLDARTAVLSAQRAMLIDILKNLAHWGSAQRPGGGTCPPPRGYLGVPVPPVPSLPVPPLGQIAKKAAFVVDVEEGGVGEVVWEDAVKVLWEEAGMGANPGQVRTLTPKHP
jgi:hypothetical protein